ncbi:MAG: TRAP transporter small permease [Burkholderiales bacterium]|nr:TRAP transporter small permease [Burkholderiales bacterium]
MARERSPAAPATAAGRFAGAAARATDALAVVLFAAMFACVLAQVVFRYFLGSPLVWSDELARYLFVWCAFLGWVIAGRRRSHLAVTMGRERLSRRAQAALRLAGALAAAGFAAVLAFHGARIAQRNWDVETTALAVSTGVVYAIVPLAALAVGLYALSDALAALRAWRAGAPP